MIASDPIVVIAQPSMQPVALLLVVVLPWLLLETWRSRRHERALRAAGSGSTIAGVVEGAVISPP